ncbi:MAG: hypothetical protein RLZZ127_2 [Planctomycetota bacterium]
MRREALAMALLAVAGFLSAAEPDGDLAIALPAALPTEVRAGGGWTAATRALTVDLHRRDGRWHGWAWSPALPGLELAIPGPAVAATADGWRIALTLPVRHLRARPTALGGSATVAIDLRRDGDGWTGSAVVEGAATRDPAALAALAAAWGDRLPDEPGPVRRIPEDVEERLRDARVDGPATALWRPAPPHGPAVATGEHPRLFLRAADLPRLRAAAATPLGRRLVAEATALLARDRAGFAFHPPAAPAGGEGAWAAGHATLYALTGDRAHARRAQALCLAVFSGGWYGGWHVLADRTLGFAVAYDLCYDAFDPGFRDLLAVFLERKARQAATLERGVHPLGLGDGVRFPADLQTGHPAGPEDRWVVRYRAAAGVAALAILGDPVPALVRPPRRADAPTIPPPPAEETPFGVPEEPFQHDRMALRWLINGPFFDDVADPLAAAGGFAAARPRPGEVVAYRGEALPWRQTFIPARLYPRDQHPAWTWHHRFGGFQAGARLLKAAEDEDNGGRRTRIALHQRLVNDAERVVQVRADRGYPSYGVTLWLNGRRLVDGDLVRLLPGTYPLTIDLPITGGYMLQAPRLAEYGPADEARDQAAFAAAEAAYRAAGRTVPGIDAHRDALARAVLRFVERTVGPAGWSDGPGGPLDPRGKLPRLGSSEALSLVAPFLVAHRTVTGEDLLAGTGLLAMPALAQALDGDGLHQGGVFMAALPFLMPALDGEGRARAWSMLAARQPVLGSPLHLLPLLAGLPDAERPAPPAPATVPDPRTGLLAASGTGAGTRAVVAVQVGPSAHTPPGAIFLRSHGRLWTRSRHGVPTVEGAVPAAPVELLSQAFVGDGSGSLTLRVAGFRDRTTGAALPITWTRTIAVDLSGAGGVAAVVAVADRIAGAGERALGWRLDPGDARMALERREVVARPVDGSVGSLRVALPVPTEVILGTRTLGGWAAAGVPAPDPTMAHRAVEIVASLDHPAGWRAEPELELFDPDAPVGRAAGTDDDEVVPNAADEDEAETIRRRQRAAGTAPAADEAAQVERLRRILAWNRDSQRTAGFLAVITLQDGEPAPLTWDGDGFAGTATVAGRRIRLVGDRLEIVR